MLNDVSASRFRILVHGRANNDDIGRIAHLLEMPDGTKNIQMPARSDIEIRHKPKQAIRLDAT